MRQRRRLRVLAMRRQISRKGSGIGAKSWIWKTDLLCDYSFVRFGLVQISGVLSKKPVVRVVLSTFDSLAPSRLSREWNTLSRYFHRYGSEIPRGTGWTSTNLPLYDLTVIGD